MFFPHFFFFFGQLFTDGITNKLIGCYVGNTMEDVVLVRIYGNKTELLVDRDEEVKSFRVLQAHGCAPQLYCTFNNGLCYEFIQGEALDPKHVCNPAIFRYTSFPKWFVLLKNKSIKCTREMFFKTAFSFFRQLFG